jgi:hypothetical protein
LNSGSSSKNNTPWWAKEISPGCGLPPPPTRATSVNSKMIGGYIELKFVFYPEKGEINFYQN